jgi:hypothetical protein
MNKLINKFLILLSISLVLYCIYNWVIHPSTKPDAELEKNVEDAFDSIKRFLKPAKTNSKYDSRDWQHVFHEFPNRSWKNGRGVYWDANQTKETSIGDGFYIAFVMKHAGDKNSYIRGVDFYSETENAKIVNAIFIKKFKPFAIFCEKDSNQKIYLVIIDEDKKALVEFSPTPQVNPLVKPINNPIVNSWYFNFDGFNDSVAKKNQLVNQGLYECQ